MADDDTYQGWKNRETWAAALHLGNDEGLYNMVREWAAEYDNEARQLKYDFETEADYTRIRLADRLKDFFEDVSYGRESEQGYDDRSALMLMREIGSLWRVEWQDVAESFIEED